MRDLFGVMWTRFDGTPRRLADFTITDTEFRMTYDGGALDLPGASLLLPPSNFVSRSYVHRASELLRVPAFVWSRIPPQQLAGNIPNIQRRIYLKVIDAAGRKPAPGIETDYEILMLAARDGIGHVDYFRSDAEAQAFYASRKKARRSAGKLSKDDDLWANVRAAMIDVMDEREADAALDAIHERVGPSPSINGMIPKLALSIPDAEAWDGTAGPTGLEAVEGTRFTDVIVKVGIPQYEGLMKLENLCYEIHRRAGFEIPRTWLRTSDDGIDLLAIERFDRKGGRPVPMESMFSVLSVGGGSGNTVHIPTDGSYQRVARAIAVPNPVVSNRMSRDLVDVVKRILFAVLTGNGDMHLENLSILGEPGKRRLSPVYDPAPMRAWPQHDLVFAVRVLDGQQQPGVGIAANMCESLEQLGMHCGLSNDEFRDLMVEALDSTETYLEEVEGLDVPSQAKINLRNAVEAMRYRFAKFARHEPTPVLGCHRELIAHRTRRQ